MKPDWVAPHPKPEPRAKKPKQIRRTRGNTVPQPALKALERRSGGACEALTDACWGPPEHPHHRRAKGPHGPDHSLPNLLAVCSACHRFLHARPDWSRRHGLILGAGDSSELLIPACDANCSIDHRTTVPTPEEN